MNQSEQFLRFVRQRNEESLQRLEVMVRIEESSMVVTERWLQKKDGAELNFPATGSDR